MEISKAGSYPFRAEPFHCDFDSRLFLGHLGNYMLNAAEYHSNDRGFGVTYLYPRHLTWVLSRLAIEVNEMPACFTPFHIETWVESAMRYFTNRNFVISGDEDGRPFAYGRSVWAMIDTDTRQPVDILKIRDGLLLSYIDKEKACPIAKSSRVTMTPDAPEVRAIDTNYSDVDLNGHINSIKYIEHIVDLWDVAWYKEHRIQRFEIAYVAESHQGDRLHFFREQTPEGEYCVRIMRETLGEEGLTEVVRSKVKFV